MTPKVGPRTIEALALVSEVVYGTPARFTDPARFSFAHGGKDGHPFPVPLAVYDRTISTLRRGVDRARLGQSDRLTAIRRLDQQARLLEAQATGPGWDDLVAMERKMSRLYRGRTVKGPPRPPSAGGRRATRPPIADDSQTPRAPGSAGIGAVMIARQRRH